MRFIRYIHYTPGSGEKTDVIYGFQDFDTDHSKPVCEYMRTQKRRGEYCWEKRVGTCEYFKLHRNEYRILKRFTEEELFSELL